MYFLQIPSTHTAMDVQELNHSIGSQQYLIPVLQSLETESQLQLILDVNVESPVIKELLRSPNNCHIPALPQAQELNLNTLNSLLINASDLKLVSAHQLSNESSNEIIKESGDNNKTVIPKQCMGSKFISVYDNKVLPRAVLTLPPLLLLRKDVVITRRTIPSCCRFGPVKGLRNIVTKDEAIVMLAMSEQDNKPVYLINNEGSLSHIDVSDQDKSNWFSLLGLGKTEDANLWLMQEDGELYAVTKESIPPRTEIKLGYSLEFLGSFGKFEGLPVVDFDIVSPVKSYQTWLYERCGCGSNDHTTYNRDISSESLKKRASYKCKLCGSRFVRRYSLKRHILKYCSKNIDTLIISDKDPVPSPPPLTTTQVTPSTDDSKLPSEDSFNNYSTLDFPTNLFDPERISNLDLSVRSDEFGLCAIGGRDDNCLNDAMTNSEPKLDETNLNTQLLSSCADCDQIIVTDKQNSHIRVCRAKKFKCDCGEKFNSQKLLKTHRNTDHKTEGILESYFCKDCKISFKRRGMLVNHEHNSHGRIVTPVLYKRIVQYRCPACPNTYSTVAKRNRHVYRHHPGVDPKDGETVKSGSSKSTAVNCADCYRQYSTRAKMMQHWRLYHADKSNDSTSLNEKSSNQLNHTESL